MEVLARSPKQIGTAIKRRRKELNLTQTELGEKIGSTQKTISNLEAGSVDVKLQTLLDVLTALNLELITQPRSKSVKNIEDIF